jgi:hypothetical protein
MPRGRKHYRYFVDTDAEEKRNEERRAHVAKLPPEKRPRLMEEFSPDELAALHAKLVRWILEDLAESHSSGLADGAERTHGKE